MMMDLRSFWMPWEKAYNETEILERAMVAFWARGYEATSVSDLVEAMGINRGSIYAAFDGKHALFMQALRHYDDVHRRKYLERVSEKYPARQAILTVFDDAAAGTDQKVRPAGCLLVNTSLELSPHDPEVRSFVNACLREVEEFFYCKVEAAKDEADVSATLDSRSTAQALLGLFLGIRVLTRSSARQSAIDSIVSTAAALLE